MDPNTDSVYTLATALEDFGVRYPTNVPDKATGLAIVNSIEWFIDAKRTRYTPAKVLAQRMRSQHSNVANGRVGGSPDDDPTGARILRASRATRR